MQTMLTVVDWEERRSGERDPRGAFSHVSRPNDERHSVILENISATGFCFYIKCELAIGHMVQIDLPEAAGRWAKIIWRNGSAYGCQFLDENIMKQGSGRENREDYAPHKPYNGVIGGDEKIVVERKWPGLVRIGLFVALCGLIWYGISRAVF